LRAITPIPATINGRKEKPRPSAGGAEVLAFSSRKNLPTSSAAGRDFLRKASLPSAAGQFGPRGMVPQSTEPQGKAPPERGRSTGMRAHIPRKELLRCLPPPNQFVAPDWFQREQKPRRSGAKSTRGETQRVTLDERGSAVSRGPNLPRKTRKGRGEGKRPRFGRGQSMRKNTFEQREL
jgi:hypothetical protein